MATAADKIAWAKAAEAKENGRTLSRVMTETGELFHLQGTWTQTLCKEDIDPVKTAAYEADELGEVWHCRTCEKLASKRF